MSKNLSSAAVVIGALRVNRQSTGQLVMYMGLAALEMCSNFNLDHIQ